MAKREIKPTDLFLFLSDGADPAVWQPVMCLTQNAVNIAVASIDNATFCGNSSTPGALSIEVPFQGQAFVGTDTPEISYLELNQLIRSKEKVDWKIEPLVPVEGDITHTFNGFLTQTDLQGQADNPVNFTASIKVDAETYDAVKFETT